LTSDPAKLALDFDEIRDVAVIGAGPVGMCTAFWAGMREASVRLIDSLPELGGQLTTLYPEKWIFDVPGHPRVLARDLVDLLRAQALEQFDVPAHLGTTASTISWEGTRSRRSGRDPVAAGATGFAESAIAVAQAVHEIRPELRIQPGYSTNTGVPGVVAGQP
jgi:NADPH-dependent 2,4-dienoyl-CoA reductase/sulfur reductase-like enzyme